jgi:hypothetical protein
MRVLSQPISLDWKQQRKLLGFEHDNSQTEHPAT